MKDLPRGSDALHMAYDNAMERIDQQRNNDRRWAQRVLSWVVQAVRPLRPQELQHALAVIEGNHSLEDDNFPVLSEVIALCAGLVLINQESNTVQLVHYTTHEYFSQYNLDWVYAARNLVATTCTTYLLFDTFKGGFCRGPQQFYQRKKGYVLYEYATSNWGYHVRMSSLQNDALILKFLKSEGHVSSCAQALIIRTKQSHGFYGWPQSIPGIHLAAYCGLSKAIKALVADNSDINCVDSYGQTPLCWAARGGQLAAARLLLDQGADPKLGIQSTDTLRASYAGPPTPIGWAARVGNAEIVELLLTNNANPDPDIAGGYSALWTAVQAGNSEVVRLLLEHNANPDLGRHDFSPLWWATQATDIVTTRLLLKHGANPDLRPADGSSPLWWAARNPKEEMVRLLLQYHADPNLCHSDGSSPLWWAARENNFAVVKLLLEHHANPDLHRIGRATALWWATKNKNSEIIQLLQAHNATLH